MTVTPFRRSGVPVSHAVPLHDPADELGDKEREERRHLLRRLVEKLDARESFILAERFGLGERGHCRSLSSLAADLGVCKERVRQLQHRATEKLRLLYQQAVGLDLNEIS